MYWVYKLPVTHVTSGFNCLRIAYLHVAAELNAFITLPTGYGKSVCYALLSFVFNKLYSLPYPIFIVLRVMNLSMHECIKQGMCQPVYMSAVTLLYYLQWRELLQSDLQQKNL